MDNVAPDRRKIEKSAELKLLAERDFIGPAAVLIQFIQRPAALAFVGPPMGTAGFFRDIEQAVPACGAKRKALGFGEELIGQRELHPTMV